MRTHAETEATRLYRRLSSSWQDYRVPQAVTVSDTYAAYAVLARTYANRWHGLALPPAVCWFPRGRSAVRIGWRLENFVVTAPGIKQEVELAFGVDYGHGLWNLFAPPWGCLDADVMVGRHWVRDPWSPLVAYLEARPRLTFLATTDPRVPMEDPAL